MRLPHKRSFCIKATDIIVRKPNAKEKFGFRKSWMSNPMTSWKMKLFRLLGIKKRKYLLFSLLVPPSVESFASERFNLIQSVRGLVQVRSVRLLAQQAENSTSGWESFWERSPLGFCFSTSAFRNVPGTVPENVHICGFNRNSSNLERAPKMRYSVLRKSWDSFSVTLPSISSEICAIYSSMIPGAVEFCDCLFRGYSPVSLAISANFRFILNVAISGRKFNSGKEWIILYFSKPILKF